VLFLARPRADLSLGQRSVGAIPVAIVECLSAISLSLGLGLYK